MTTETDLRNALRSRADDAPTLDADRLLAVAVFDGPGLHSTAGTSYGRRWAIAGVAAGFVALAAVGGALVAGGDGPDTSAPGGPVASASSSPTVDGAAALAAAARARVAAAAAAAAASAAASRSGSWPVDPSAPTQPRPAATDWQNAQASDSPVALDDSAVVFGQGLTAFYIRGHEQLVVVPVGGTAKDNSDATTWIAVHVYLPGSGFDPSRLGDPETVTVNGIERKVVTLPRLLGATGAEQVTSLLWQVGDAWVALQVDTPAATSSQLADAAALLDIHHG